MLKFFSEVIEESKKLEIPTKKDVMITSITIIIVVIISSLFIISADFIISKIIALIFGI